MRISAPVLRVRGRGFAPAGFPGGRAGLAFLLAAGAVVLLATATGCDSGGGGGSDPSSNQAPSADFTATAVEGEPMTYAFDAGGSEDADGEIAAYQWDFGDGESATGRTVEHTYDSGGEMEVTLTVVDEDGASGESTQSLEVGASGGGGYDFSSDYAYNLNVIYFVPAGMEPLPGYRDRLSGFLLYIQDYYREWMGHWGYEDRTFGLLKDEGRVKITRVNGEEPVSAYPNDGGGRKIRGEVRAYFQASEATPDSEHYLVFTPKPNPDLSLPYYAIGKWGFVSDIGQQASTAEQQGGGVVHELGHAVNLPHNAHPASLREELGAAIMHDGNNVWNGSGGASATSLTEASAAILRQSQVFSREEGAFYGPVEAELRSASGTYRNGEIVISGTYESDVPVREAIVLLDPEGGGTYDQQAFPGKVAEADSFRVRVPTEELFKTQSADYTAKVWLVPEHQGRMYVKLTEFSFAGGVPNIDFQFGTVSTLPKEDWEVTDYSDQEPTDNQATGHSQVASNVIDGDWDTFWHSRYSDVEAPLPHTITVDMGEQHEVKGLQFVQREGISAGARRVRTQEIAIRASSDGEDFESLGEYTLENTGTPQQVELESVREFQYFQLVFKSSFGADPRTSLAEVGVFGPSTSSGEAAAVSAEEGHFQKPPRNEPVQAPVWKLRDEDCRDKGRH